MSVSPRLFEVRDRSLLKYRKKGYLDLDSLIKYTTVSCFALVKLDILMQKVGWNTGDLEHYDITKSGREYFVEKPFQLLMVKPSKIGELIRVCNDLTEGSEEFREKLRRLNST